MPVTQIVKSRSRDCTTSCDVHKHSKKQIAQIVISIAKFGFTVPIITKRRATYSPAMAIAGRSCNRIVPGNPSSSCPASATPNNAPYLFGGQQMTGMPGGDRTGLAKELQQLGPLLSETGLDSGLLDLGQPKIVPSWATWSGRTRFT